MWSRAESSRSFIFLSMSWASTGASRSFYCVGLLLSASVSSGERLHPTICVLFLHDPPGIGLHTTTDPEKQSRVRRVAARDYSPNTKSHAEGCCKFGASLGYVVSLRLSWAMVQSLISKEKGQEEERRRKGGQGVPPPPESAAQ